MSSRGQGSMWDRGTERDRGPEPWITNPLWTTASISLLPGEDGSPPRGLVGRHRLGAERLPVHPVCGALAGALSLPHLRQECVAVQTALKEQFKCCLILPRGCYDWINNL